MTSRGSTIRRNTRTLCRLPPAIPFRSRLSLSDQDRGAPAERPVSSCLRFEADPPDRLNSVALWKTVPDSLQVPSPQTLNDMQGTFGSSLAEAAVGGRDPERIELVQPHAVADGAQGVEYLATQPPRIFNAPSTAGIGLTRARPCEVQARYSDCAAHARTHCARRALPPCDARRGLQAEGYGKSHWHEVTPAH